MNPMTNELIEISTTPEEFIYQLAAGFEPLPKPLQRAAKLKLGKKKSVFVSKKSGGKLSKWAAKRRKDIRAEQERMVAKCNAYYREIQL